MNSPFKFPRRVRIHGGECGAVARALHHKVKGSSLYQADHGKYSGSTNERKQMSTKTTLKRIALVAVSALGFGLLSVTSSSATVPANKNIFVAIGKVRVGSVILNAPAQFFTDNQEIQVTADSTLLMIAFDKVD